MIEDKLEQLLTNPNQLGAEFDLRQLCRYTDDLEATITSVKKFFRENETFFSLFSSIDDSYQQDSFWDEMINLSLVYAYYFALDYILRQKGEPDEFDCKYIRKALPTTIIDKNSYSNDVYRTVSSQFIPFIKAMIQQKDPMHFNPLLVANDEKHIYDNKKRNKSHFSGQIPQYFQKIFSINYSEKSTEFLFDKEHLITDLLPALTLMSLKVSKYIPMGTYADEYSIKKVRSICETLHYSEKEESDKANFFSDYEIALDCKYPDLIYSMAREDLFHIGRLNNAICSYRDFVEANPESNDEQKKTLLATSFSLSYHMPSVWFQEYYKNTLHESCTSYAAGDLPNMLNHLLPIIIFNGIVFPQVLLTMLYALFTDRELKIYPVNDGSLFKNILFKIETYFEHHMDSINKHFKLPDTFIWDNPRYILSRCKNKGNRNTGTGKIHRPNEEIYELIIPPSQESFEDIVALLISSEPRWRYTTIIEENRVTFTPLKKDWPLGNHKLFLEDKIGTSVLIRYASYEYFIRLSIPVMQAFNMEYKRTLDLLKKLESFPLSFD